MKRWMIVAEPGTHRDGPLAQDAARAWNTQFVNAGVNRYWTKGGAVLAIAEFHDAVWGNLIHFRIVRVRDFMAGWR